MACFSTKKEYLSVIDKKIVADRSLSLAARWLLIYVFTVLDSDEFELSSIASDNQINENELRSYLVELINAGYLRVSIVPERSASGDRVKTFSDERLTDYGWQSFANDVNVTILTKAESVIEVSTPEEVNS